MERDEIIRSGHAMWTSYKGCVELIDFYDITTTPILEIPYEDNKVKTVWIRSRGIRHSIEGYFGRDVDEVAEVVVEKYFKGWRMRNSYFK